MTAPTMIERAARAIYDAWKARHGHNSCVFDALTEQQREWGCVAARAVIEALREPSGAVLDAMVLGDPLWSMNVLPRLRDAWIRGIDAVLSETNEQK